VKTHPISRPDGSLLAFEVTSAWVTFRPLYKTLRSVPGVSDIKRNLFNDDRITFTFQGESCVVNEPWGDSSCYWIGPLDAQSSKLDMTPLHRAFQAYRSPVARLLMRISGAKLA
jgi:hypothetical protein